MIVIQEYAPAQSEVKFAAGNKELGSQTEIGLFADGIIVGAPKTAAPAIVRLINDLLFIEFAIKDAALVKSH